MVPSFEFHLNGEKLCANPVGGLKYLILSPAAGYIAHEGAVGFASKDKDIFLSLSRVPNCIMPPKWL
jgi:hypothetical protein